MTDQTSLRMARAAEKVGQLRPAMFGMATMPPGAGRV